ncbi:MAG: 3-dehydroquinate synthase [Rickettsiales bacterium]
MAVNLDTRILHVELKERTYPIVIGSGVFAEVGAYVAPMMESSLCFVVTDDNVAELYLPYLMAKFDAAGVRVVPFVVPAGEKSKSMHVVAHALEVFLREKPDRHTPVVALGGGVVGDIAGFIASILLRGAPFFQIPTTLLSQVDSSVGGKTGVNAAAGKNLIGTFYQPKNVLIDVDLLRTLPAREARAGYAEIVKYGLIRDAEFFEWLMRNGENVCAVDPESVMYAVEKSCAIKADVVAKDERETGVRAILNLGHTFGHAYEHICGYDGRLLHGEAVAFGMIMAADLSHRAGIARDAGMKRVIEEHLEACGLPTSPDLFVRGISPHDVIHAMEGDKKNASGRLKFVLLKHIGEACLRYVDDRELIAETIAAH